MTEVEECIKRYRRVIELLDLDCEKMALAIQGDILDEYLKITQLEKDALDNACGTLRYYE